MSINADELQSQARDGDMMIVVNIAPILAEATEKALRDLDAQIKEHPEGHVPDQLYAQRRTAKTILAMAQRRTEEWIWELGLREDTSQPRTEKRFNFRTIKPMIEVPPVDRAIERYGVPYKQVRLADGRILLRLHGREKLALNEPIQTQTQKVDNGLRLYTNEVQAEIDRWMAARAKPVTGKRPLPSTPAP